MHSLDLLQVVVGVLIGHVGGADVQLEVWSEVLKVIVVWELCGVLESLLHQYVNIILFVRRFYNRFKMLRLLQEDLRVYHKAHSYSVYIYLN